jgi:hypothetical protein
VRSFVLGSAGRALAPSKCVGLRWRRRDIKPYCVGSDDCIAKPRGRCEGYPAPARCIYPPAADEPCTADEDCRRLGLGQCFPSIAHDFNCYPTGECSPPGNYCTYDIEPCAGDADCSVAPGGECVKAIEYAQCTYDECTQDEHCGEGRRCGCFQCLPASCTTDGDCDPGRACTSWQTACERGGYTCTTSNDECAPGMIGCECAFLEDHFQCSQSRCE